MDRELKGWSRPRPLRVAFLVEDNEHGQLALDGVFADCYSRWGGRFSLIVPCSEQRILAEYWPWLEAYDPDVVYSYVALGRNAILEIHERLAPGQYLFHKLGKEPRLDTQGFKPEYRFKPLASLSVIFSLARGRTRTANATGLKVIDSWFTERASRLLGDNLGTYLESYSTGMYPPDAESAASLLTIVSPDKRNDRQYGVPKELDAIDSELDAFAAFAARRATGLSLASAVLAPRLDIGRSEWSTAFNLVVGDSFQDRILFWNARLHIPNWLDSDLCCFRVDMEKLRDAPFLAALGDILKHRNHVNGGSGGSSNITIRSISLTPEQLAEAQQLVASTKPWSAITTQHIKTLDEVVPTADNLKNAREVHRYGFGSFHSREWAEFSWVKPKALHTPAAPEHLDHVPVRQAFARGYWYTDFVFEHERQGPRLAEQNRWMLSKRWRMEGAFQIQRASDAQHVIPPVVRRSNGGCLAVPMCIEHPIESITIPTPYKALQHALAAVGRWAEDHVEPDKVAPPQRVAWTEPSNEARHLIGILGMAGGLQQAAHLLLHPFLERTFAKLGGTTRLSGPDVTPTVNRLEKRSKHRSEFNLKDLNDRTALAHLIVQAARGLGASREFIPYDELQKEWKIYRESFWATQPKNNHADPSVDWDGLEAKSLDECLVIMRRKRMIFQGHAWTCQRCLHKNWVDLGAIKPQLDCDVCNRQTHAPVDIRWIFRPNEFLIESLRNHSVLSLVWTLAALCYRARSSIVFVEPTWFGFTDDAENPDAEADLMVLVDGQALLCEVKASWSSLRGIDIESLVKLAKRLRPDIALLAIMESGRQQNDAIAKAHAELLSVGITFEVLTLDTFQVEDGPYLGLSDEEPSD